MNFYGHLVVASWYRPGPLFGLGAMLPDLESMAGARFQIGGGRPSQSAEDLAAGVKLHHATDAAFHRAPDFCELVSGGVRSLQRRGIARGSARAVAHVGIELLLDGELASDRTRANGLAPYRAALRAGHALAESGGAGPEATTRFPQLLSRLEAAPIPLAYRDPSFVAQRLERILADRPRLALHPGDERAVTAWLTDVQPAVRETRCILTTHVHAELA